MNTSFSVVLSGGGCKTFWAVGALQELEDLFPPVDHWAGSSAGAAMSLARVAGRFDESFATFLECVAANPRNVYPQRMLRRERAFPHDRIYRSAAQELMRDGGFARVREGAPVHMMLCYVRAGHPFVSTTWKAIQDFVERRRQGVLHGPTQLPAGIGTQVVCSHAAMDAKQLIDWTLMSSTIPPVTPIQRRAGRRYLDGGLIDNIPIRALPAAARGPGAKILCLVSHAMRVPEGPVRRGDAQVLYLAAREPPPVRVWDYTSPQRVQAALDLGRREGRAYRRKLAEFLNGETPRSGGLQSSGRARAG